MMPMESKMFATLKWYDVPKTENINKKTDNKSFFFVDYWWKQKKKKKKKIQLGLNKEIERKNRLSFRTLELSNQIFFLK